MLVTRNGTQGGIEDDRSASLDFIEERIQKRPIVFTVNDFAAIFQLSKGFVYQEIARGTVRKCEGLDMVRIPVTEVFRVLGVETDGLAAAQ